MKNMGVVVSGFCRGVNELFALLECYAVYIVTDVSGQPFGSMFNGKAVRSDGTGRFSPNVGNYQSTLREVPE
jgi:hypothetical protein